MWPLLGLAVLPVGVAGYLARELRAPPRPCPVALRMPLPRVACDHVEVLAERPDGSRDVLCGRVRETLPGEGTAAVAAERFASDVVSATPVERGWVFVTADGTVTRSDGFVGRLRLLGRVPCAARWSRSVGRSAVVDADGAVWTTDGAGPLMKWTLPRAVRSVAFASATHGAAVLERGELFVTDDAGREWTRVDLGGDVAARVTTDRRGALLASTTAGIRAVVGRGVAGSGGDCEDDWPASSLRRPGRFGWGTDTQASEVSAQAQEVFAVGTADDRCGRADPARSAAPSGDFHEYHCSFSDVGRPTAGAPRGQPRWVLWHTGTEHVEEQVSMGADGTPAVRLEWRGRDARGAFAGRSGPAVSGITALQPGPGVMVEAVSREGLLLAPRHAEALLWARRGGPIGFLAAIPDLCLDAPTSLAAVQPDGGVAWVRWHLVGDEAIVVALEAGPDGALRRRRNVVVPGTPRIGLGRWDGAVGVVAWPSREISATAFYPMDASPTRALPASPLTPPHSCEAPPSASAGPTLTLWRTSERHAYQVPMDGGGFAYHGLHPSHYELEVGDGATCVRRVLLQDGDIDLPTLLHARPGDRFESERGDVRVSCVGIADDGR